VVVECAASQQSNIPAPFGGFGHRCVAGYAGGAVTSVWGGAYLWAGSCPAGIQLMYVHRLCIKSLLRLSRLLVLLDKSCWWAHAVAGGTVTAMPRGGRHIGAHKSSTGIGCETSMYGHPLAGDLGLAPELQLHVQRCTEVDHVQLVWRILTACPSPCAGTCCCRMGTSSS
jgi:hypothetical protein